LEPIITDQVCEYLCSCHMFLHYQYMTQRLYM
jgi:hypothetical protein